MSQRDRLFNLICEIKFTAIYGTLYARRIERVNLFVTALLAFAFSGTFCSFWFWEEHPKMLATVMLFIALVQNLNSQFGFDKKIMRIRIACNLLESLYDEAVKVWHDAERANDELEYSKASDTLRSSEGQITAIAGTDVRNDDRLVAYADALMKSQINYDFNL